MPTGADRRAHEPAPGPDLDERRRDEGQPVDRLHRQAQARAEGHEAMMPDGDTRSRPRPGRPAVAARRRAPRRDPAPAAPSRPAPPMRDVRPDLVASRLDRPDQLATPGRRVASTCTVARSVARLTVASRTPSVRRRYRSMRLTQEAQVMPWTSRTISMGAAPAGRATGLARSVIWTRWTHEVGAAMTPGYSHGVYQALQPGLPQRVTGRIANTPTTMGTEGSRQSSTPMSPWRSSSATNADSRLGSPT